MSAHFSYSSQDPYGIHVTFHHEERPLVTWVFGRDLLAEGSVRLSGLGDVRIWPEEGEQPRSLLLELTSPYGYALLSLPADAMTTWLAQTYHLVPPGFEETVLNLDDELSQLLGEVN
ncbi:SsgA family sporulation/cell division regulator [Streptomyces werraensis]|uniref:SsgA family sporulation/cell division regulator n=1 Tax=Streptomyces werraensis TaxID=68284 RepID=UPI001CE3A5C2